MKGFLLTAVLLFSGVAIAQEAQNPPLPEVDADSVKILVPLVPQIASLQSQQEALSAQQKSLNAQIQDVTKRWVVAQTHAIDLANQKCNGCLDPRYVTVDVKTGKTFVEQSVGPLRPAQ